MPLYYFSFCDVTKPEGEKFLGATVVEGANEKAAIGRSHALGINPGGEIAILELPLDDPRELPEDARKFFERFVAREEVLNEPHHVLADSGIEPTASVCQAHNPRRP